ncbi:MULTISPECIES: PTS lactose/cellobiose transporter subunit IIA [Streptococcus]|uniref:PTS lactose/cellobiose transporter subunit IIA n=1 Tax=Streptococcus caledonicus TaxID=2614158 RepID=A0ABW0UDS1_9STRE|nr:PTS lactose/cellobiose transporter subunit IIA [Streptococcus sp. S784/96/1]
MENNSTTELAAMTLIANSGDARSLAFQALEKAKLGKFSEAENLLKESDEKSKVAHKAQTELLFSEAGGDNINLTLLMVHAQDHLMTSMLAVEMIREFITLYQGKE